MTDELLTEEAPGPVPEAERDSAGAQMTLFAVIVSAFLFVRKFAGLIKEHLLARFLGATGATDAFKLIYNGIIYNIYSDMEQLLRPTYLPEFIRQRKEEEGRAWRLAGTVATLEFVVLTVIAAGLMIFARPIIRGLWPDLAADPVAFQLAVLLLWIMAPGLVLFSLSLMPELTLHAHKRFTLPAFAEACYNILLVVVLFVGVELLWHPGNPRGILAAGFGMLVGGSGRLFIMLPGLWSKLGGARVSLNLRGTAGVTTMLALMPPILLGLVVSMARPIVDGRVCTRLGEGMYSALDYGRRLSDAGIMILPLAVSLVVFPYVSEWAVAGDRRRLSASLLWMTRALAFLFVPLSVGMILLARPLCDLIYNYGEFKEATLDQVALALMCYASGLFVYSIEGSINKWYFAMKDTWTPNWVGVLWALGHLTISVVGGLYTSLGLAAVALAYPISKTGKVVTLYLLLRPRLERVPRSEIWPFVGKLLLASAVMGAVVWWVGAQLAPGWEAHVHGKARLLVLLGTAGGAGALVFLVLAALLRIEEVGRVWQWLGRKVRGK
jgi:putative peptidoglycan lipid II flippase